MPLFAHRWSPEDVDVDGVDLIERLAKASGNVLRPDFWVRQPVWA